MKKNTHQDTNTDTHTYAPSLKTHMHTETNTNQLTHTYSSHEYSPQKDKNCHWLTKWQFFQIKRLKKQEKLFWDKRAVILHFPFHHLILTRLRISKIKTMLAKKSENYNYLQWCPTDVNSAVCRIRGYILGDFSTRWKRSDFAISFSSPYVVRTQMPWWQKNKEFEKCPLGERNS